jgi:hypothetical protein
MLGAPGWLPFAAFISFWEKTEQAQMIKLNGAPAPLKDEHYIANDLRRTLVAASGSVVGP